MTQPWKRHLVLAALVAAPVLSRGGTAFALPPGVAPPSAADVQRATQLFGRATELFKAHKYVPALEQFKQSYALVASPNSHLYIARCLSLVGDARAAWLEFDRTADEATADGPKYAPTHDSALQERDEVGARVALLTVSVQPADPAMSVRVGAYEIPPDRWGKPYPVEPGTVDVTVQLPGRPPATQQVAAPRGQRTQVTINAAQLGPVAGPGPGVPPGGDGGGQPARPINGLRIGAYVAAAVGVAGFVMLGVEGSASKSTFNTLSTACGGAQGCPNPVGGRANADNLISTGKSQQAIANAGLGLGIAGIAVGGTLFALSLRRRPADSAAVSAPASAELVVGPSWIGAQGSF